MWGFGDGYLGRGCNREYPSDRPDGSNECELVFRARATTFVCLTWFALFLAWEMVDMRRSFFRMQPHSRSTSPNGRLMFGATSSCFGQFLRDSSLSFPCFTSLLSIIMCSSTLVFPGNGLLLSLKLSCSFWAWRAGNGPSAYTSAKGTNEMRKSVLQFDIKCKIQARNHHHCQGAELGADIYIRN